MEPHWFLFSYPDLSWSSVHHPLETHRPCGSLPPVESKLWLSEPTCWINTVLWSVFIWTFESLLKCLCVSPLDHKRVNSLSAMSGLPSLSSLEWLIPWHVWNRTAGHISRACFVSLLVPSWVLTAVLSGRPASKMRQRRPREPTLPGPGIKEELALTLLPLTLLSLSVQATMTEMPSSGLLKRQTWFSHVLEGGSPRSRCWATWCLLRPSLPQVCRTFLSLYPCLAEGAETGSCAWLIKAVIHSRGLHPQDPLPSQRPHLQIPTHWRLGFQPMNFGGWVGVTFNPWTFSPSQLHRLELLGW